MAIASRVICPLTVAKAYSITVVNTNNGKVSKIGFLVNAMATKGWKETGQDRPPPGFSVFSRAV
jgi:hypothetical protein